MCNADSVVSSWSNQMLSHFILSVITILTGVYEKFFSFQIQGHTKVIIMLMCLFVIATFECEHGTFNFTFLILIVQNCYSSIIIYKIGIIFLYFRIMD